MKEIYISPKADVITFAAEEKLAILYDEMEKDGTLSGQGSPGNGGIEMPL